MDKLFEETESHTDEILFKKSEVIYLKEQELENKLFGLNKVYHEPKVFFDITKAFFNGKKYKSKALSDFDDKDETKEVDFYNEKPIREEVKLNKNVGYCIRSGIEIPFNPKQPMSKMSWKVWNQFGDEDYPEQYCHKTGKKSNGKTSMRNPILD